MKMTNLEKLQSAIDTLGDTANSVYGFAVTGSVAYDSSIYRFSSEDLTATITIHYDDSVDAKVTTYENGNQVTLFEVNNKKNFHMVKFISMLMEVSSKLKYFHQYELWAKNAKENAYQSIDDYKDRILEE